MSSLAGQRPWLQHLAAILVPMRRPITVAIHIVLVAASFAGGAIVNGPGLRWAQAMVLNRLGLDDGNPDAPRRCGGGSG